MLVLDSGGLSRLAERSTRALSLIRSLRAGDLWPPVIPTIVLVESLQGHAGRDPRANRLIRTCIVEPHLPARLARRAAELRRRARLGSAVDAVVVALGEPDGTVLTSDAADITALATHARNVGVEEV